MKNYRAPEMEVTKFSVEDIITLSAITEIIASVTGYDGGYKTVKNGYTYTGEEE